MGRIEYACPDCGQKQTVRTLAGQEAPVIRCPACQEAAAHAEAEREAEREREKGRKAERAAR